MAICVACAVLTACGGGGGSSGSGGGGGNPTPTPSLVATGVNIGNVSTIPLGNGGGNTSAVVTNNFANQVTLTSATFTLFNSTGAVTAQSTSLSTSPVNTSGCSTIQANGSCNIALSVPIGATEQGQYLVTMNFLNPANGKTITTSQLISYSTAVPINSDGIQVSTINNTLYNVPGGSTTYSVPFVLTQAVSNLSASSQNNNPAFAPTIACGGTAPYPAGTSCTLYIRVSQTGTSLVIPGNITVSSVAARAQVKSKLLSIKGTTGYLFNVPVTVIQNNTGNLITSAINVIVNPAGASGTTQTITLFNNGAGTINGITINGSTPTAIGSNTCSSLAIGGNCTFTVSAPSITQNTQAAVVVNYSSNGNNNSIAFNVSYIVPTSTAGMSMTVSGNFNNTVINTTPTINITESNTGTATLTNITFTPASDLTGINMSYTAASTCATDGTQILAAGQSCVLVVQYAPTVPTGSNTVTIRETAKYLDPAGNPQSYTAATGTISYSAITGPAFVYINPNYVAYGIRADGSDTATQTFVLVNAGPISTTVSAESLANPPVTAYSATGGTCSFPQTLTAAGTAGESCTVTAQFGATSSTISTTSQMTATYTTSGSNTASAFSNLSFTSSPAALVVISNVTESGQTGGSGTSGSPFTFTNSPTASPIQFTITYQNNGTESALTFSVMLNSLPAGFYPVSSMTCGYGATTSTLAPGGGTCTAIFKYESAALYNSYALNGTVQFNLPGWSFNDATTGLNINTAPTFGSFTPSVYVTANA